MSLKTWVVIVVGIIHLSIYSKSQKNTIISSRAKLIFFSSVMEEPLTCRECTNETAEKKKMAHCEQNIHICICTMNSVELCASHGWNNRGFLHSLANFDVYCDLGLGYFLYEYLDEIFDYFMISVGSEMICFYFNYIPRKSLQNYFAFYSFLYLTNSRVSQNQC